MSSSPKILTLRSSDNETFEVEEEVVVESQTIKHMIEEDCADATIPLANLTSSILAKVIEYCKKHVEFTKLAEADKTSAEDDLKSYDAELVDNANQHVLFDLIVAANYLNIKSLLDLTCQKVADTIKDMKPEEVRKYFNIDNGFTPEEEELVRNENAWAYEWFHDYTVWYIFPLEFTRFYVLWFCTESTVI